MNNKPTKGEYLEILLRSSQTVFCTEDVVLLWRESNTVIVTNRLKKYVKVGKLIRVRRGLYVKDKNYNKYELANKILKPSYISFETVLKDVGMIFQYYGQIFCSSYVKRELDCDGQNYYFCRVKNDILTNPTGVEYKDGYTIASKERAFLDTIYRSKKYYFDNLSPLDWDKVFEILPIYRNKKMMAVVKSYYERFKNNNK